MRTLFRLGFAALLIASCNTTEPFGIVECVPRDQVLHVEPRTMHLVFGTVGEVVVYHDDGCVGGTIPADEVDAVVRDSSVASLAGHAIPGSLGIPERIAVLWPETPGRTHLVVEVDDWVDSVSVIVPDTVTIASFTSVEAGGASSCGVAGDGTALCWGFALGFSSEDDAIGRCWGALCSPIPVPRMSDAAGVWIGSDHACAVDGSGRGWCWGDNESNQVDETGTTYFEEPRMVSSGRAFSELSPGWRHTCGLTTDQDVECWGRNDSGQLGLGDSREVNATPSVVEGEHTWVSLTATESTTCGVTDVGALLCWGYLAEPGVTVPGSEECSSTVQSKSGPSVRVVRCATSPLRLPLAPGMGDDTFFVEVSGVCALTSGGGVGCYDRITGQVGPVEDVPRVVTVASSWSRACALTASGEVWCWGQGPLGDGRQGAAAPVQVTGSHVFTRIAVGATHSCGVTTEEEAWCWGSNDVGESGTSILDQPLEPTRVRGQS